MIITDYYRFEKLPNQHSKLRLDCLQSTKSYNSFEEKRATKVQRETEHRDAIDMGNLIIYYGDVPDRFGGDVKRKASKSISIKGNNLSSVYVPDVSNNFGYGDMRGTTDALLFAFDNFDVIDGKIQEGATLEIFICRGMRENHSQLYNLLCDGELDDEIATIRKQAVNERVTITNNGDGVL
jgi:hypothetical protein